jgi:hypothetical protein
MITQAIIILAANVSPQLLTVDQFMALPAPEQSAFLDGFFQAASGNGNLSCPAKWYYNGEGKAKIKDRLAVIDVFEKSGEEPKGLYGKTPMAVLLFNMGVLPCVKLPE